MRILRLNKTIVECKGNAAVFLNGLTSNALDKPMNAFLNIHGRIIATFEQYRIDDSHILLSVANDAVEGLMAHASRYAKLNKTVLTVMPHHVYADLDNKVVIEVNDVVIPYRTGRLIITNRQLDNTINDDAFTLFRLEHHLPLEGIDFKVDEMILNVSAFDYVSFTKGCFLGQEPVAKVHHRAKPTWKLVVKYQDECTPEEQAKMTSVIKDPANNRLKGFVFVKNI